MIVSPFLQKPRRSLAQAQLEHMTDQSALREAIAFYDAERHAGQVEADPFAWADALMAMVEERSRRERIVLWDEEGRAA